MASFNMKRAAKVLDEIRENMVEGQTFEDLDPEATEIVGIILGIARGTIRGRYTATRLSAAVILLHQYRGRPMGKHELELGDTLAQLIEKSMVLEGKKRPMLPSPEIPDPDLIEDAEIVEDENVSVSR